MSLEEAFLRDVVEHPDDDAPRVAYADWLQEQADPLRQARGEFIAAQVAIARVEEHGDHRHALKKRARQLFREHRRLWLLDDHPIVQQFEYHRGFLERVTLDGDLRPTSRFLAGARALFRAEPCIRHLRLQQIAYHGVVEPGLVVEMLRLPERPRLTTLVLERNELSVEQIRALTGLPGLVGPRRLLLSFNPLASAGVSTLVSSPFAANLEALVLIGCGVGEQGAIALAGSPHLGRLLYLGLGDDDISATGLSALAQSRTLRSLYALGLTYCNVDLPRLRALLMDGPLHRQLRRLELTGNPLDLEGQPDLQDQPFSELLRPWL